MLLKKLWDSGKLKKLLYQVGAQDFSRGDWIILGSIVFLLGMVATLVASESIARSGAVQALRKKDSLAATPSSLGESSNKETGIYNLPPVTTALGDNSGNAEMELSLEYYKGAVREVVQRVTLTSQEEEYFFSHRKGALLDSIVSSFSELSHKSFTTDEGMEKVKDSLVTSMNEVFIDKTDKEIIREVYFRKLTFFPLQF